MPRCVTAGDVKAKGVALTDDMRAGDGLIIKNGKTNRRSFGLARGAHEAP